MRCCSGLPVPLETGSFEDSVTSEALQLFLSRMVKRGGDYRWSCEKLNGGLGRGSPKGCSYPDPVYKCETNRSFDCKLVQLPSTNPLFMSKRINLGKLLKL